MPSATLRLGPGEFDMLGEFPTNSSADPLSDVFVVERGYAYSSCVFVTSDVPLSASRPSMFD
jgi:hypothetical protein